MSSPLLKLSEQQWEDLCESCGRCCLVKLQDEDTNEVHYTNVACEFLDLTTCRCSDYENRNKIQPDCMVLSRERLEDMDIMPFTCAYRATHEARVVEDTPEELSVRGKVISELYVHPEQITDHIIDWIKA